MNQPGGGARVVEHHGVDGSRTGSETTLARTGRLGRIALALLLALLTPACESARPGGSTASPGRLDEVGDELVAGKNRTGESCRIRFAFKGRWAGDPYERFDLYCEGWTQPSGHILRSRFSPQYPPAKALTTGPVPQNFSSRLGDCGETEATSLADGTVAVLRECKRIQGGWPMLVVAAHAGLNTYVLETFPTNLPLLELAVDVLRGGRIVEGPAAGSAKMSAAIRRAETMVGASGRLLGIQDVGAHATLYRLGTLRLYAGDDVASEEAFRRALEIEERVLGPDHPSSGQTLTFIARNAAVLRKAVEAERLFARAEPLVQRSFVADHYPNYLTHQAQALRIDAVDGTAQVWSVVVLPIPVIVRIRSN